MSSSGYCYNPFLKSKKQKKKLMFKLTGKEKRAVKQNFKM